MLGDGPLRGVLDEMRRRCELASCTALEGWADQHTVATAYAWADVFCCPSILAADGDRDGLPNVLVEAMSTGLPVIGSAFSGIPEAIDEGVTGLLALPGDAAALAANLARYADPALRAVHGAAARAACAARFDGERWLDALEQVLRGMETFPG